MDILVNLPERYEPHEVIGRGPASIVLRATDHRGGREVAIKAVRAPAWLTAKEQSAWRKQVIDAVRPFVGFWHPNLALTKHVGEYREGAFLVRPLMRGRSLAASGRMAFDDARLVAHSVALALDALASRGLSHGALLAEDIFIEPDGAVIVTDAGVGLAATSAVVAGRRCRLPGHARERCDVRALASILYETVTGETPVWVDGALGREEVLPRAARHAFRRALRSPNGGFTSAGHFIDSLEPAPPSALVRAAWQPAAAAGMLVTMGSVGGFALSEQSPRPSGRHGGPGSLGRTPAAVSAPAFVYSTPRPPSKLAAALRIAERQALRATVRRSGAAALLQPAVAQVFGLSAQQRAGVAACLAEQRARVETLVVAAADGTGGDTAAPMAAIREETTRRLAEILGDDQRALYDELTAAREVGDAGW